MHVRFQNSCKIGRHAKKGKNACSILKIMRKRTKIQKKKAKMHILFENLCKKRQKCIFNFENLCKKRQKCILNFEIHTKKAKMKKKKAHFCGCFNLYISCGFLDFQR